MRFFSWIIFFFVLLLEGTVTTLPLTFIFLLCLVVMKRADWIFMLAFFAGLLLDLFAIRPLGITSLLLVGMLFLILLYEKKYEIATVPFVFFASFLGSLLFVSVNNYGNVWFHALLSMTIAVVSFMIYKILNSSKKTSLYKGL